MPFALASVMAGMISSISSVPKSPPSPACGFRPATATRGSARPNSLQDSSASSITFNTRAFFVRLQASRSDTCVLTWMTRSGPPTSIIA